MAAPDREKQERCQEPMTSDCSCSGERRRLRSRSSPWLLPTAHAVEPQIMLNEVEHKFAVAP